MNKNYRYLFKNIGLLTLSNFGSKILVFLLVPLYTSVLSTTDYGIYDLFYTSLSLLIPILTLNISDGVLRFALDKETDDSIVYSIGLKIIFWGSLLLIGFCFINYYFSLFPLLKEYTIYFILLYLSNAIYGFLTYFIRGIDKVTVLSIASVLYTLSLLLFNILFLLAFKSGLTGYFWANILAALFPSLYILYKLKLYNISFKTYKDKNLEREMIEYSHPLILNSIGWWINNAADRYVVIAFCGVAVNGIYSVGYKIPSILNILANIFNQAWVLSSVKSFDEDKNKEAFFSQIYNSYNTIFVFICGILIALSKIIAGFLYANTFYEAWVYVPFLLISNVFGAVSGFAGGIFSAAKDSKLYSASTLVGAGVNLILNLILVYYIGAIGAAIATMIAYFVVWLMRIITMKRYVAIKIPLARDLFVYVLLVIQSLALIYMTDNLLLYLVQLLFILLYLIIFRKEVITFKKLLENKLLSKRKTAL